MIGGVTNFNYMNLIIRADKLLWKHGHLIDYIQWNKDDKFTSQIPEMDDWCYNVSAVYMPPAFTNDYSTINLYYSGKVRIYLSSNETSYCTIDDCLYNNKQVLGLDPLYNKWWSPSI